MLKKLFFGLLGLVGISLGASADNGIRLLGTDDPIMGTDGKEMSVKYYCKQGKVFVHIYGVDGAKDNRVILPFMFDTHADRLDPQMLCSEFKDWESLEKKKRKK